MCARGTRLSAHLVHVFEELAPVVEHVVGKLLARVLVVVAHRRQYHLRWQQTRAVPYETCTKTQIKYILELTLCFLPT